MKIQLIEVDANGHEAEVGSCDLCMYISWVEEPTYVFSVSSKDLDIKDYTVRVDAYDWSWGHYDEINLNAIEFAHYLNSNEFAEVESIDMLNTRLYDIMNEFQYSGMNSDTYLL